MSDAVPGAIVIVGGGTTLGAAIAGQLSPERGVALADGDAVSLERVVDEIRSRGGSVLAATGCLGDAEFGRHVVADAAARFGGVSAVVNVVRQDAVGSFLSADSQDWDRTVDETLGSLYAFCRPAVQTMRDSGRGGRIITVSSRSWLGEAGESILSAVNGAVTGFTRALALEVGRFGVTVNALACAYIDTPEWRGSRPEQASRAERATAVRRPGTPDDVAAAVEFLAGEGSAFLTGQVIALCGGSSIGKSTY